MDAGAPLIASAVAAALAAGVAVRAGIAVRHAERALRGARAREGAALERGRRLGEAACRSVAAVREEIDTAARSLDPAIDGVLLYEEEDGVLHCVLARGTRFRFFGGSRIALDDRTAPAARALCAGGRVTLADPGVRAIHPADRATVAFPVLLAPRRGCVFVAAAPQALAAATVDGLAALAEQAAPAYRLALERERDRRRAEFDGLTGLLTAHVFRQRLTTLLDGAPMRPTFPLALLFLDTDRFKEWNDAYGHGAGDALLRELAGVLRAETGERDLVARNGGDEFCVVLSECDKARAIERAAQIRARIAALHAASPYPAAGPAIRIGASIGVAAYPLDAETASELLERADRAMYHSKRTGRNGVSYIAPDGALTRLVEERA